jgi:hypothetical protein
MSEAVPQLHRVGSLVIEVGTPIDEVSTSEGVHRSIPILGGTLDGELGEGFVLAGGADRQIVHADGTISIDARYEIELADSTIVAVHALGVRASREDGVYFRTGIRLTTTSGRSDLNGQLFISTGYRAESSVVLDLFRLT